MIGELVFIWGKKFWLVKITNYKMNWFWIQIRFVFHS